MHYPRIRLLRLEHGMTQSEVAKCLKVNLSVYRRCEKGMGLKMGRLISLADLYETTIEYILGRTDNPAPPNA